MHGIPVGPGLYRLFGTDPNLPFDDLEPLHFVMGNARVIGLGESIHTVGSFYEMKHRVFRFLVEETGVRALGFESPWIAAEVASDYVRTCEGSSLDAARSLLSVFESEETRALLEWMCEWNQRHPKDLVHFYGFDIQNRDEANTAPLIEFLKRLDPWDTEPLIDGILACDGAETSYYPTQPFPEALYTECQNALNHTEQFLAKNRRRISRLTSPEDLAWARVALISAQAWQEQIYFIFSDFDRAYAARDRGMADVAMAIREIRFPRAKVALWAHNGHVNKNGPQASNGLTTMGTFLDDALGKFYVSLALSAYDTYTEWPFIGLCGGPFRLFGPDPVEIPLQETGEAALLVDFNPRGHHPGFFDPEATYSVGGLGGVLADQFDGMIYLESARAMDPLFLFEPCP